MTASLMNIKGFGREAFEQVHALEEQVTSIRLNPFKSVALAMNGKDNLTQSAICNLKSAIAWCPHGFYLPHRPSFTFDPLFHAGVYYVQEASSMFLWEVLKQTAGDNTNGMKVLDLCAAPGGKSTLLASYFQHGLVVANEVIKARAAVLVENITKWGSANVIVSNNDPKDFSALPGYFDIMVIDAPCSGSGLFRRDAQAINEWSEENVQLCSQRQQRILADAYAALKNGGLLVYSTCSYSKQEDEDILDWLCGNFEVENLPLSINGAWGIVETESDIHKAKGYRFYPYKVQGEGFFIAAFRKKDGIAEEYRVQGLTKTTKEETEATGRFIQEDSAFTFFKQGGGIIAIPVAFKNDVAALQKHLYLRKAGITAGSLKGSDFVPAHELAMSMIVNKNIPGIELAYPQAIQYLQKKDIETGNFEKGWSLATYGNINLGWMKVLPNRVNNYYPVEWRILKDAPGR
ncbi:MAG TPA: hypothetical protein VHB48_04800 [Chitinophagaceae bacterium]|nr:hypothetical protein [Chitinophagaceae bacterium]